MYYYRARYYDPKIGRFISEDPIGFEGGDVNLYSYVLNNEVEKLQKEAIEKIEERTRALAKGALYGIPIGVFCAAAPVLPF